MGADGTVAAVIVASIEPAFAEFLGADGAVTERCSFIAINKSHIEWVMPADADFGPAQAD